MTSSAVLAATTSCRGRRGNDYLDGGEGKDELFGSRGATNTLLGGAGEDNCDGGSGADEAIGCESETRIP